MSRPKRSLFEDYTPRVAQRLIGMRLVRKAAGRRLSGLIVETEAYRGFDDPASHAFVGKTRRNAVMFGDPGHAYVYFTYGFHHCLNVTTEPRGVPGAVLLRAIRPTEGVGQMLRNRGVADVTRAARGPGNLTKAMLIDGRLNGVDLLTSDALFLEEGVGPAEVDSTARVGIGSGLEYRWRYVSRGSPFASRLPAHRSHNYPPRAA